jgi:hypothetical protein
MRARRLIDGTSFGPDALNVTGIAFCRSVAQIAGNFGNDPSWSRAPQARKRNAFDDK